MVLGSIPNHSNFIFLRERGTNMQNVIFNKVDRHEELALQLNETYRKKNNDYGDSFGKSFEKYGITAALVRMEDKWNRLNSLAAGTQQMVNDESIIDTLCDLANYSLMTVMEIEKRV